MSEDKRAQTEAWIREKPRRIIQNQTLIMILSVIVALTSWIAGYLTLWLVFTIPFAVPIILVVWAVTSVSYIIIRVRQNRKS